MQTFEIRVAVSNSHVHLSEAHLHELVGASPAPEAWRGHASFDPSALRINVRGPKGAIAMRLLTPCTRETWVELSRTHARQIGVDPPLAAGELSAGELSLEGPRGSIRVRKNVILERRHLELLPVDAERWGLSEGQRVEAEIEGPRAVIFREVETRILANAREGFESVLEVDRDEANAALIDHGARARIRVPA